MPNWSEPAHRHCLQDRKGEKGQVWQCVANVLRSHAAAVQLFRQLVPKGKISMALNSDWCEPLTSSAEDQVHGTGMQLCCLLCVCKPVLTPSLSHGRRRQHGKWVRPAHSRLAACTCQKSSL